VDQWKDNKGFILRITADLAAITASWFLAYFLRFYVIPGGIGKPLDFFARLGIVVIGLFLFFLNSNKLYSSMRRFTWIDEITSVILASVQAVLGLVIILYFFFPSRVSRLTISIFLITSIIFLILERIFVKNLLYRLRAKGWNVKNTLVAGFGPAMEKYIDTYKNPCYGIRLIGQFGCETPDQQIADLQQYQGNLEETIEKLKPDIVVISLPEEFNDITQTYISACYDHMSMLMVILNFHFSTIGSQIVTLNGQHVMQINNTNLSIYDRMAKRLVDIVFSLLGIILLSPIMLVIALLVTATSRGPVFFVQKRVTRNDRIFSMYKFRTMQSGADTSGNGTKGWTVKNDPRTTRIGKFLRRTSLDELPQLFNVLAGNMSSAMKFPGTASGTR